MNPHFLFGRGRAAERFAFVAPCSFIFLLILYLTFTVCLRNKIKLNSTIFLILSNQANLTNLIVRF